MVSAAQMWSKENVEELNFGIHIKHRYFQLINYVDKKGWLQCLW